MRPVAALTAAPRSVGVAVFHGQDWVNTRHMPGVVPPPTRLRRGGLRLALRRRRRRKTPAAIHTRAPKRAEAKMMNQPGSVACQKRKCTRKPRVFWSMKIRRMATPTSVAMAPKLGREPSGMVGSDSGVGRGC